MNDPRTEQEGGRWFWFRQNLKKRITGFLGRHKLFTTVLTLVLLYAAFTSRSWWQPGVLWVRIHIIPVLVALGVILLFRRGVRKRSWRTVVLSVVLGGALGGIWFTPVYEYLALHERYITLHREELAELPVTDHERIQPLNSIYSYAHAHITDAEDPQRPDFVRVGNEFRWTMAIEPKYQFRRISQPVRELYNLSATSPAPNFDRELRVEVEFDVGENLLFGRNTHVAAVRAFNPWQFCNYQAADITYLMRGDSTWVQVVSLIKWTGMLFPRPEFGGVMVIDQQPDSFKLWLKRTLVGRGTWISPERIGLYPYLKGQNIMPFEVSRRMAQSFRFQAGFLSPFPGRHRGDIRIPDLPEDVNDQPFTTYFHDVEGHDGLFHYFSLEPYDPKLRGLNTSLFIPADGTNIVYVYKHAEHSGSLTGVSAVGKIVRESKKNYDWARNRPVEHRPFIRVIDGKPRFLWLTTIVTLDDAPQVGADDTVEKGKRPKPFHTFIAGSLPEMTLTDAQYKTPVWVDPLHPELWEQRLHEDLGSVWAGN